MIVVLIAIHVIGAATATVITATVKLWSLGALAQCQSRSRTRCYQTPSWVVVYLHTLVFASLYSLPRTSLAVATAHLNHSSGHSHAHSHGHHHKNISHVHVRYWNASASFGRQWDPTVTVDGSRAKSTGIDSSNGTGIGTLHKVIVPAVFREWNDPETGAPFTHLPNWVSNATLQDELGFSVFVYQKFNNSMPNYISKNRGALFIHSIYYKPV